jgi:solute carrier family 9 (sodium/hydrogen exchanger), member 6/7
MKHYAYHNMSRRTQLTTKFVFQVMAQLSENFIFIYLGLSLFTDDKLVFKPLFILITVVGICVARWCAVFPLSRAINWFIRYRAKRNGNTEGPEELPYSHQVMLFWAGLRGAVGVALAAGLSGENGFTLRATVLVVVVLTVIIFGGTTARMLEILNIRTGVVEEIDSDDEFDIEYVGPNPNGTYARTTGKAFGHNPRLSQPANGLALGNLDGEEQPGAYSTSNGHSPSVRPDDNQRRPNRRNSARGQGLRTQDAAEQGLLSPVSSPTDDDDNDLDLPPAARRISPARLPSPGHTHSASNLPSTTHPPPYPTSGARSDPNLLGRETNTGTPQGRIANATSAVTQLISGITEDPAGAFRQIDEGFIKPRLLLDPGAGGSSSPHGGSGPA